MDKFRPTPEQPPTPEPEKPPHLYHGSPNREIKALEPRQISTRDEHEGPRVFATPDLATATFFMANLKNYECGYFDDTPYMVIPEDRDEFMRNDRGGAIYKLPSNSFTYDQHKGLGELEWTSESPVIPLGKTEYPSALQALMEQGVQVYFVDTETYHKIQNTEDHGLSILQNLESENERLGINPEPLSPEQQ